MTGIFFINKWNTPICSTVSQAVNQSINQPIVPSCVSWMNTCNVNISDVDVLIGSAIEVDGRLENGLVHLFVHVSWFSGFS